MLTKIIIKTEFITLGQFLKFANLIDSGSQQKIFIENNDIFVNGVLEKRRGRKLYPNDQILVKHTTYEINK